MFKLGSHLAIGNGYYSAAVLAVSIGANTFQYFSRNPRGGSARKENLNDINEYKEYAKNNGICFALAHAPYTLNACSSEEKTREFAKLCMRGDIKTLENFDNFLYNFHPGSHTGQGVEAGIIKTAELLNEIITPDQKTVILLETMSGKGSEIGRNFLELKKIIEKVNLEEKTGVCIDTCHLFSAGYDIVNNLDGVLEEFDTIIGINKLKAIHLNDSKMPFNSNLDRHELIGQGEIGLTAIARIINHKYLRDLPFYLETPTEDEGHKKEIELLKSLRNN